MFGLLSGVRQCLGEPCGLTASEHIDRDMSSLFLRIREIPTPTHSDSSFVHYLLITVSSQHQGAPKHTYGHIKVQIYTRAHLPNIHTSQFHHLFITDSSPDHPLMPGSSFACTFHDHLCTRVGTAPPYNFFHFLLLLVHFSTECFQRLFWELTLHFHDFS